MATIRCLDVSGIFFPIWRVKEAAGKPIGDAATEAVQALRERAAAGGADYVVACCDSGRCFRHDIALEYRATDPDYRGYKGNRPERDAALIAALDRVIDNLEQDGVPVFRAPGFEADDILATLATWATAQGHDVEIVSDDKDLRALVCASMTLTVDDEPVQHGGVSVVKRDGEVIGPAEVKAKFGVEPHQMAEYLAMVGDTSDHVKGIPGIGETKAAAMLSTYGTFAAIYEAAERDQEYVSECECQLALAKEQKVRPLPTFAKPKFQNATRASILSSRALFEISLRLTRLRTDVPVDFAAVTAPRVPKPKPHSEAWRARSAKLAASADEPIDAFTDFNEEPQEEPTMSEQTEATAEQTAITPAIVLADVGSGIVAPGPEPAKPPMAIVPAARADGAITPARFARYALEPRNYEEARTAAEDAADSKLYKGIETPMQALQVIMKGRKYGLTVADSLQMIHMIEGKPSMSAQLIIGLVMSCGLAEYLDFVEVTDTSATWETRRRGSGNRPPKQWKFTLENAQTALLGGASVDKQGVYSGFDPKSNWAKHPKVMCLWRAGVFLCRAVYTDVVGGLYMPDELGGSEPEIDGNLPTHGHVVMSAA